MRTLALIKRIILEVFRDKRTLALLFIAPLLILTLMYLVFNGNTVQPSIGVQNVNQPLIEQLEKEDIQVKEFQDVVNPKETMMEHELDAFLEVENDRPTLVLLNSEPAIANKLQMKIKQLIGAKMQAQFLEQSGLNMKLPTDDLVETEYVYGNSETVFFDVFSPILVGFFVFFFVFLISGIGLLKERTSGTLERLMATPIRRWEIVAAYLVGFGLFAILQTIIIVLFSIHVLDIVLIGSIWNVILINLILALVALSLGTLLSSFASSEFQMVQFIPIAIVPQIFFSGIFPLEGMPEWLQVLGKVMPLYYAADGLTGVMYKGMGLADISQDIYILIAFALLFIVLNLVALKKYRKL